MGIRVFPTRNKPAGSDGKYNNILRIAGISGKRIFRDVSKIVWGYGKSIDIKGVLQTRINEAVSAFWETKQKQLSSGGDSSNRGAVTAGKQLDGFIALLKDIAIQQGVPEECIYVSQAYLPGYFRSSKDWDFLIVTPKKKLAVAIELKSQVGSYGNNFNNRTEEAVGSAVDLWTAFREKQFPDQQAPWIGYLTVVGQDDASTSPVKNDVRRHIYRSIHQLLQGLSYRYC